MRHSALHRYFIIVAFILFFHIFQERVKRWMDYTWTQQKSFDEHAMLSYLPMKMRTDIAMRVHYSTLGKVKLFKNCEPGLLKDLVVLLRPIIYLPGDYICRKNDIGKEMFIIQSGQVQVNIILICGETGTRNTGFWVPEVSRGKMDLGQVELG